jgi:hypothetical protein
MKYQKALNNKLKGFLIGLCRRLKGLTFWVNVLHQ